MSFSYFVIDCSNYNHFRLLFWISSNFLFSTVTPWNVHFCFSWSKNWDPCHYNPNSTKFLWICRVKIRWNIISSFYIHNVSNDQNSILYPYLPHFVNLFYPIQRYFRIRPTKYILPLTLSSFPIASVTSTINCANKTQPNNSSCGKLWPFKGATWLFPAHKVTFTHDCKKF